MADAPALGSAILGAAAAGLFPDVQTAAKEMVRVRNRIEPDPARHEAYRFFVEQYIATFPPLQKMMHETVRHVSAQHR